MNELQQQVDVEGLYGDVCRIVEQARGGAYRMANVYLTLRNWLVGERIAREDLQGAERAEGHIPADCGRSASRIETRIWNIGCSASRIRNRHTNC